MGPHIDTLQECVCVCVCVCVMEEVYMYVFAFHTSFDSLLRYYLGL